MCAHKSVRRIFMRNHLIILSLFILCSHGAAIASPSDQDAASGMRGALTQGADAAVASLGASGGFMNNPKVKIDLPEPLKRVEKILKMAGLNKQANVLIEKMNAAAESAIPLAKPLLINAIKSMSLTDAKAILTGGGTSVTEFFKSKTQSSLQTSLLPLVKKTTDSVGLAQQYNNLAKKAAQFGLIKTDAINIEQYVTSKTVEGLYIIVAEEEQKIRANPLAAASSVVQAVFGALKK
jgi:Protein of unknown function (DUF4197)